ncbi:MAG: hypothetical protein AAFX05_12060 [Planctomycetota bacterium]
MGRAGSPWQQKPSVESWLRTATLTLLQPRAELARISTVRSVGSLRRSSLAVMTIPIPLTVVSTMMVRGWGALFDVLFFGSLSFLVVLGAAIVGLFATHSLMLFGAGERRTFASAAGAHGIAALSLLFNIWFVIAAFALVLPMSPFMMASFTIASAYPLGVLVWICLFIATMWRTSGE